MNIDVGFFGECVTSSAFFLPNLIIILHIVCWFLCLNATGISHNSLVFVVVGYADLMTLHWEVRRILEI